jgi:hypothetical protein
LFDLRVGKYPRAWVCFVSIRIVSSHRLSSAGRGHDQTGVTFPLALSGGFFKQEEVDAEIVLIRTNTVLATMTSGDFARKESVRPPSWPKEKGNRRKER